MRLRNLRYESLLKYRMFLEEEKMGELAEATEKLDTEEKRLFAMEEIRRQAFRELEDKQSRRTVSNEILMYQAYLQHINMDIEEQRKRVEEAMRLYEDKRECLLVAAQERKIIEKIRDKDKQLVVKAEKKAEKKALDETGNSSYVREHC